ncbi:MAG: outer membrane beta-barrel protein [Porticoccaceae bacterium]|nr:outer membrane beta-barrel protein [Porticoccaceae bacterium]
MLRSIVTKITVVSALTSLSLACYGDTYATAGFGFHEHEELVATTPSQMLESSLTSVFARAGKHYTQHLSAEVRLGIGLGDDVFELDGVNTGLKLSIREFYGVYVRGGVQLTEKLFPYVVVGYTQATFELGDDSFSVHEDFGGLSYGVGGDIVIKQSLSTNIEYMHYFDTVGVELTGFSVGLTKSF